MGRRKSWRKRDGGLYLVGEGKMCEMISIRSICPERNTHDDNFKNYNFTYFWTLEITILGKFHNFANFIFHAKRFGAILLF